MYMSYVHHLEGTGFYFPTPPFTLLLLQFDPLIPYHIQIYGALVPRAEGHGKSTFARGKPFVSSYIHAEGIAY